MVCATTARNQDILHENATRKFVMTITKGDTIMDGTILNTSKMITTNDRQETSIQDKKKIENSQDMTQGITIDTRTVIHGEKEVGKEHRAPVEMAIDSIVVTTGIALRTRMRMVKPSAMT